MRRSGSEPNANRVKARAATTKPRTVSFTAKSAMAAAGTGKKTPMEINARYTPEGQDAADDWHDNIESPFLKGLVAALSSVDGIDYADIWEVVAHELEPVAAERDRYRQALESISEEGYPSKHTPAAALCEWIDRNTDTARDALGLEK